MPKDHLLRKIEKVMDYEWLYERLNPYYCHNNGRPGTDPVVLIKMVLIQHLYGIPSLRQTYQRIQDTLSYRWFLGYGLLEKIPHFATVSYAFCNRFPEEPASEIFEHILNKALNNRMVDPGIIFIDGTHIKASANKKKYQKEQVAKVARIYSGQLRKEVNAERERLGKKPIAEDDEDENKPQGGSGGTVEKTVSATDPDCGMFVKGKHEKQFAYEAHTACDRKGFVLDVEVTAGNVHDSVAWDDLCDRRRGIGQCAGLVEHNGVRLCHRFQKATALDRNAVSVALPHGGQHRDGDRRLERTGKVDHHDREHLGHVAGEKIGERRPAEGVRHQLVRHFRRLVLDGRFQPLRFLDHMNGPVIPPATGRLFHTDNAFAFLNDRARIDQTAGTLDDRHGFSGHGGLIHCGFALCHLAVQRDHTAGSNHDAVAGLYIRDLDQNLGAVGKKPDMIHLQAHDGSRIGYRFFVRPLLQYLAQTEHKHHRACGGIISPHDRYRDGGRVQNGDRQLSVPQSAQTFPDISDRTVDRQCRGERRRQEQFAETAGHDGGRQLVLKLPIQHAGRVIGNQSQRFRLGKREARQCADHVPALCGILHHGILRPVIDLYRCHAVHSPQIVFQYICLPQRHAPATQMHPDASRDIM